MPEIALLVHSRLKSPFRKILTAQETIFRGYFLARVFCEDSL
jgi:hypothetical protein